MDTPTIRPATPTDGPAVAGIFAHYVTNTVATFETVPPSADDWGRRIAGAATDGFPFLVADVRGDVVGYAYASPWRPKPAYRATVEDTVYLAPGHGGRGLGRALLTDLLGRCAEADFREVIAVIADTGDQASAALHTSLGFRQVGVLTRVGHKSGRWIDTLLMQRSLP
jgi:phosphinothricin acetyltransferase